MLISSSSAGALSASAAASCVGSSAAASASLLLSGAAALDATEASLTRLTARFRDARTCGALLFHARRVFTAGQNFDLALAIWRRERFLVLIIKS